MQIRMRRPAVWHDCGVPVALDAGAVYDVPAVVAAGMVAAGQADAVPAAQPAERVVGSAPETGQRRRRR